MVSNKQIAVVATLALVGSTYGFVPAANIGARSVQLRARNGLRMAQAGDPLRRAEQEANKVDAKLAAEDVQVIREAPVIKERIHEKTVEVDKTEIEEERIRTEVRQKVQPIKDERREQQDLQRVQHEREVNEHGQAGLDKGALDELERRRQEVAATAGTQRDATTEHLTERPDVIKKEKVNVVEQVVPVVELDVYIPHRVEHEKQVKEIIHEKPIVHDTVVEPVMTKAEFEKEYGTKVVETSATAQKDGQTSELRKTVTQETSTSSSSSRK